MEALQLSFLTICLKAFLQFFTDCKCVVQVQCCELALTRASVASYNA